MPRPRFTKLPPERRERILIASAKEFAVHGFDGASLNHILGEAGVSKGAAYYYFDSKADLFSAVLEHFVQHLLADAGLDTASLTAATFWPKIFELYHQAFLHGRELPWLSGLSRALLNLPRELREAGPLMEIWATLRRLMDQLLKRGQALGVVRTDLPVELLVSLAFSLDEAFDRWMLARADMLSAAEMESALLLVARSMRRLLEPQPEANP